MLEKLKMNKLRHIVAGLVIVALLAGLLVTAYNGMTDTYDVVPDQASLKNNVSVMERINNMNIIEQINQTQTGVYKLSNPTGTTFDIIGSLQSVGIGFLGVVGGIITLPFEITSIILEYYPIPALIITALMVILVIYVGFIILSAYLKTEI